MLFIGQIKQRVRPEQHANVKAVDDETGMIRAMWGGASGFDGTKPALAEGEEDPRAERYRPKPLPADQKPIDVLKELANEDRKKWEMDLNRARLMAGYPAFRKVGFEDIGRLEVALDDYADGVE
ncbi:hypothetical protein B0H13DRAFT_1884637 [Mycena leptocephala]|nr:hypothetical protein B0H13DRAFT_1884637 [Mycena leptocephala]